MLDTRSLLLGSVLLFAVGMTACRPSAPAGVAAPDEDVSAGPSGDTPTSSEPGAAPPSAGGPQCRPTQFVAGGACFDASEEACASLGCEGGCRILETAPAQVVCE